MAEPNKFSRDEFNDVMLRVTAAESYVKDWHNNVTKWREYYDTKVLPTKKPQYKDPTFVNTVDLAVGIMLGNALRWHAFGFSPSKIEQELTGKAEKLIQGILFTNDLREEKHLMYELFLNFVRDGGGVLYSVVDPRLMDEYEDTTDVPNADDPTGVSSVPVFTQVPLRVQNIDPMKFFALPGGPKRWLMVGRKESLSVLDVEIRYDVKIPEYVGRTEVEKSSAMGAFLDIWDYVTVNGALKVRNTIVFEGTPLRGPRLMEGYDDLPYSFQFYKPTQEESKGWHNIMKPMESSLLLLEKSVNRRSHQIDVFTGLPLISKTQGGRVVQVDPGLYNHVQLSLEESIEFPAWPGNAPDVREHQDFLRSRVQQSGFSDVMYGSGQSQIAGYALSQLSDQNRIRMEQPIKHLELLLSVWARKAIKLLSEFTDGYKLCVYGIYKGKRYGDYIDINDVKSYPILAEVRPKFPSEETRKVAMATQSKGLLSRYTIMERFFDIEQPEDEEERLLIEMASNHPLTIQYSIIAELKRRVDEENDEVAKMVLDSIEKNGIPGMAGRPKEENNPEQLMGVQSPTGEPVPQAAGGPPPGQGEEAAMERAVTASPTMEGGIGG